MSFNQELSLFKDITPADSFQELTAIMEELQDTFNKKQIFRTDTEARISVLNDGNFPTLASKYWQAVREQNVMLENLVTLSFDYRRNENKIRKTQRDLDKCTDDLDREELQIELDELYFRKKSMELVANDRVREVLMWSKIKQEVNDGTFDTANVNTHQAISLKLSLENRLKTLSASSSQPEILNVVGPLDTINRYIKESGIQMLETGGKDIGKLIGR
jgi:hypothetical protein